MGPRLMRGLVVALALCLAGAAAAAAPAPSRYPTAREVIESWAGQIPLVKRAYEAFPDETLAQGQVFVDRMKAGASDDELKRVAEQVGEAIITVPRRYLASAPTDKLLGLAQAWVGGLRVLKARDEHACAQSTPDFRSDPGAVALNSMGASLIEAMKAGRDTPQTRTAPSQDDLQALGRAMSGRLSPESLAALRAPGASRTDHVTCDLLISTLDSALSLPPDVAGRVLAASLSGDQERAAH